MVVPFAAGGPVDTIGRIVGARLGEILGQQVVVENVSGAGGKLGMVRVAKAQPDGYTFLLASTSSLTTGQSRGPAGGYALAEFTPVILFADSARILIVRRDFPAATLGEFTQYAKVHHGEMHFGSAGHGSGAHVCASLLNSVNGTAVAHVAYRGTAQAMLDLVAGRLDFICEQVSTAAQHIASGAVKPIAVMGPTRVAALPSIPTARELGLSGLDCNSWSALFLPRDSPQAIAARLAEATVAAVETPSVRERLEAIGVSIAEPERRTMAYLPAFVAHETSRWGRILKMIGVAEE